MISKDSRLPPCVLCGSALEVLFQHVEDYEYHKGQAVTFTICTRCKLITQQPLPAPSDIPSFYPHDYRNHRPECRWSLSFFKRLQTDMLVRRIERHLDARSRILEIGCGSGHLLMALKDKEYAVFGNDFIVSPGHEILIKRGIPIRISSIETEFPFDETFDAITLVNVIEHLRDPIAALSRCRDHLSPNGKIICVTPQSNTWTRLLFGKYWAGLHAPRHIYLFNSQNIRLLQQKLGFPNITIEALADPGDLTISMQNALQAAFTTQTQLSQGLAWYTPFASAAFGPLTTLLALTGKSASMMAVFSHTA